MVFPKLVVGNEIVLEPAKVNTPQLVLEEYVTLDGVPEMPETESTTLPDPE